VVVQDKDSIIIKNELTILIPVFNEQLSIEKTISKIKDSLLNIELNWEVICINDGSTDDTGNILSEIQGIKVINHKTNKGYGASLKTGLRHATYSNICITDADGTYPNEKIPTIFQHFIENGLDMAIGARIGDNVHYPFFKKIPKFFIIKLANYITNSKIPDINSGFRIFKKKQACEFFHLYPNGFSFTTTITIGMLCRDYEVDFIPIDYYKREGKSKIHPWKDTLGFFKLLLKVALYFNPFKFFTPFIIFFTLISLGFLIKDVFIFQNLTQSSVFFPMFTFLIFTLGLLADLIIKHSYNSTSKKFQ